MEIVANYLDWTTNDEQVWAGFLSTETGKRLLPKLAESTPGLLEKGDTNEILIRTGKVAGLQLAVQTLLALAHPAPPESLSKPDNYPALENDDAWADGEKLDKE